MQGIVRAAGLPLFRQLRQVDLRQQPVSLGQCRRGPVVGQGHPGGQGLVPGLDRIIVLGTEPETQPAVLLSLATAGEHRVDVHLVDLARESVPGRGILGGAGRQQYQHHCGTIIGVTRVRDSGRAGGQPAIQPEIADLRRIGRQ